MITAEEKQLVDAIAERVRQRETVKKLVGWIRETAEEPSRRCGAADADRGMHAPECMAYLLDNCPVNQKEAGL